MFGCIEYVVVVSILFMFGVLMMVMSVVVRRLWLLVGDCVFVGLGLLFGFLLRFEFSLSRLEWGQFWAVVGVFCVVRVLFFGVLRLYSGVSRYVGLMELRALAVGVFCGSVVLGLLNVFVPPLLPVVEWVPVHYVTYLEKHPQRLPWSIVCLEGVLSFLFVGGYRVLRRGVLVFLVGLKVGRGAVGGSVRRRVLVVGAGDAGEGLARTLLRELVGVYELVGFVDDDRAKAGCRIRGVEVLGGCGDLGGLIVDWRVDEVWFAIPSLSPGRMRSVVEACGAAGHVLFKRVPSVGELVSGRVAVNMIRAVEVEDLLGREPVTLDLGAGADFVRGASVLVSGGGGSIGSELCRQLCGLGVGTLVVLGKGENSVYEICRELTAGWPGVRVVAAVGDVRDRGRVRGLLGEWRPSVVFHAAAHKHVPLMELCPSEAVRNNVFGTLMLGSECLAAGVGRFILVSTDKAVRPTSVMGASKRVAEMVLFNLLAGQAGTDGTRFAAVRFGNVLGSRGSVVPLFRRQVAAGGPVTVTHPDVTRFFMTIPEAVSLVIQAGSRGEQRRLYLLDMGEPVRVADLAANVIRLSGFEPGRDIRIEFTGLRQGEKLYEELLTEGENVRATDMGRIFCAEPDVVERAVLEGHLARLRELVDAGDEAGVREELARLVPDFSGGGEGELAE